VRTLRSANDLLSVVARASAATHHILYAPDGA
jgi:hypothetical protein